ncbi:hypothetical protein FRX31_034235 [Thalictrum thalictroides]|uniref:Uncharacterized protein n=1 Tax=Thalictrum thalictroides TaxID=46969 RepID=A0A7J6UUN3_THATH|nr:hypothetical protein FRX31_034235 [Thalictrum thalictroides]
MLFIADKALEKNQLSSEINLNPKYEIQITCSTLSMLFIADKALDKNQLSSEKNLNEVESA